MNRRAYLTAFAGAAAIETIGSLRRIFGVSTDFKLGDPELAVDDPPIVRIEDGTIVARGTVRYASSNCGTVELAHARYERSQDRLDVLVVAANDSLGFGICNDDLVDAGYRLEASVRGRLRQVTVTEHHAFGDAYSTTATTQSRQ